MDFGSDDLNWWIEQERLAKQQELETQVDFVKEEINADIVENLEDKNLEDDALAIREYYNLQSHLKSKHALKNRKTYERRNKLRKENNLPTKRGSRGNKKMSPDKYYNYCKQLESLENRLDSQLYTLLGNGNIIGLFKIYGIELKETYLNYKGFCFYHKEKTASFSVSKSKPVCRCYGCGKGHHILRYIFQLTFGQGYLSYTIKRLKKLESQIAPFLELPSINHFDRYGNPTERADPDTRKFLQKKEKGISNEISNPLFTDDESQILPF